MSGRVGAALISPFFPCSSSLQLAWASLQPGGLRVGRRLPWRLTATGESTAKSWVCFLFWYACLFLSIYHFYTNTYIMSFPGGSDSKESACNAGGLGSIPGSGRSPGEGKVYPFQYSCLENPMDRGAWWATVHGVTKSQT